MIAGGIMGHAQALINPYVYGVRWRRSALALGEALPTVATKPAAGKKGAAVSADPSDPGATPSTAAVVA